MRSLYLSRDTYQIRYRKTQQLSSGIRAFYSSDYYWPWQNEASPWSKDHNYLGGSSFLSDAIVKVTGFAGWSLTIKLSTSGLA